MLKSVRNDTTGRGFCGPTAVAAITGKPLSRVLNAFREAKWGKEWKRVMRSHYGYRYTPPIKGTSTWEVRQALSLLGWRMGRSIGFWAMNLPEGAWKGQPTVTQWLKARPKDWGTDTFLIEVTGHWIVIRGRKMVDTFTKGVPVNLKEAPHRRARVQSFYRIEKAR